MEILITNITLGKIQSVTLEELTLCPTIIEKYCSSKNQFELNIFANNEIINSKQLTELKSNIKKLKFNKINIYSNQRETILTGKSLRINSSFVSEKELKDIKFLKSQNYQKDILHKGTVRSGDRISSNGDLFIIGDVNPGAIVSAKKNVFIWGKLLGIAFAGEDGNKDASIASLYLSPLQLRIDKVVAIGPKEKPRNFYPEVAILENGSIIIKPFLVD